MDTQDVQPKKDAKKKISHKIIRVFFIIIGLLLILMYGVGDWRYFINWREWLQPDLVMYNFIHLLLAGIGVLLVFFGIKKFRN